MAYRFGLALIVALAACAALAGSASAATTAAAGTLTGSADDATRYTLTVQNTGDTTIGCLQFTPVAGVNIVDAAGAGATVASGVLTVQGIAVAPHDTAAFPLITDVAYPAGGGGTLVVGSACTSGPDTPATGVAGPSPDVVAPPPLGGPIASPPPPNTSDTGGATDTGNASTSPSAVKTTPCECADLTGAYAGVKRSGRVVTLSVRWTMRCTQGGGGCAGQIGTAAFPGAAIEVQTASKKERFARGRTAVIRCSDPKCAATRTVTSRLRLTLPAAKSARLRDGRTLRVRLRSFCLGGAAARQTKLMTMTMVFDAKGRFDRGASDTNGDGKRDDHLKGRVGRGSA
jgi:hypothetical protein